jgi:hypothetical protein
LQLSAHIGQHFSDVFKFGESLSAVAD